MGVFSPGVGSFHAAQKAEKLPRSKSYYAKSQTGFFSHEWISEFQSTAHQRPSPVRSATTIHGVAGSSLPSLQNHLTGGKLENRIVFTQPAKR